MTGLLPSGGGNVVVRLLLLGANSTVPFHSGGAVSKGGPNSKAVYWTFETGRGRGFRSKLSYW